MSAADVRLAAEAILGRGAGRHLLLLSDFDGTLCEFDPDPEAVQLPEPRRALLEDLGAKSHVTLGIVSGRRLADVRSRTGRSAAAYYAGLHGLEIEGGGERYQHPDVTRAESLLGSLLEPLAAELSTLPGVFVEDKGLGLVAHYRAASAADGARAEEVILRHGQPHIDSGVLRTMRGAFMLELLPAIEWHKGSAVEWIRERVLRRHPDAWTLYIGDDITDEDAFRAVKDHGLSVAASSRAGGADFAVEGPVEVEELLRALASASLPV
jgi:alpha,alpha-trehalase